jgi:hypothetical protein
MTTYEIPNGFAYRTDDEGRASSPPTPPEQFVAPRVTASAATSTGTAFESAGAAIAHANKAFQRHVEATNENRHLYTDEGFRDQLAKFSDTAAVRAVDQAVEQVRARRDQATADIEKFRRNLSQLGDAAQESRNTRYWNRTKAVLDRLDPAQLFGAAQELLAKAERDEISVLAEELTPYIAARGGVSEVTNKQTGAKRELIDIAIEQVFPEYAQAKKQLKTAAAAATMVEQSATVLRKGIEEGRPVSPTVLQILNPDDGRYDPDAT